MREFLAEYWLWVAAPLVLLAIAYGAYVALNSYEREEPRLMTCYCLF